MWSPSTPAASAYGSGADTYTGFLRTNTDLIVDALG